LEDVSHSQRAACLPAAEILVVGQKRRRRVWFGVDNPFLDQCKEALVVPGTPLNFTWKKAARPMKYVVSISPRMVMAAGTFQVTPGMPG
jgi:hypothetical protein